MSQHRSSITLGRRPFSAAIALAGILLLVAAFFQATDIPLRAHDDFGALIVAQGGRMSHAPEYPSVYRQMSANRRMLQNAYLGGSGLVLLAVGCFGLTRVGPAPAGDRAGESLS